MRVSLWFFGISAVALLAAGGISAGCGSDSSKPPATTTTLPDATPSAIDTGCYVDASLTMFAESDAAGAGCAQCVNTMCGSAITSCETDCTCISLFECLLDAGYSATDYTASVVNAVSGCVPGGLTNAGNLVHDPGIKSVYNCFTITCLSACSLPDGGDAASASSADGGAAADAGLPPDAADSGAAGDAGPPPGADGG